MNHDRLARRNARIRGSGTRTINVQPLEIKNISEDPKPKELVSALINDNVIDSLPRHRRPSNEQESILDISLDTDPKKPSKRAPSLSKSVTKGTTSAKANVNDTFDSVKEETRSVGLIKGSLKKTFDREFGENSLQLKSIRNKRLSKISTPEISKRKTSNKNDALLSTSKINKKSAIQNVNILKRPHFPIKNEGETRRASMRLRSLPRSNFDESMFAIQDSDSDEDEFLPIKEKSDDDHDHRDVDNDDDGNEIDKKPRKPRSSVKRTIDKTNMTSGSDNKVKSNKTIKRQKLANKTGPPIPLTKNSNKQAQKALTVDIERLQGIKPNSSIHRKQNKLTMLDVIHFLVKSFVPMEFSGNSNLDQTVVHEAFKLHLLYHLTTLQDYQASINNIMEEVKKVEKEKNEVRQQIFELREKHTEVGNEMNKLRSELQTQKSQHDFLQSLDQKITSFSSKNGTSPNINDQVQKDLVKLDRIINPRHGIYQKLLSVNNKLMDYTEGK